MSVRDLFPDDDVPAGSVTYWNPQPGQDIAGYVVALGETGTQYGNKPHVDLRTDSGHVIRVVGNRTVLANELREHRPNVGDALLIKYDGPRTTKTGRDYHRYVVKIARAPQQPADPWDERR